MPATLTPFATPTPALLAGSVEATPAPAVKARLVSCHRELLAVVQERVGSRSLAEGILQDVSAHRSDELDSTSDDESVVAWFMRRLRTTVLDYERRHEVTTRGLAAFAADLDDKSETAVELRRVVKQTIAKLAEDLDSMYAKALRRIDIDGLAVEDYASEVGIKNHSTMVVRVWVSLARKALKKRVMLSCMTSTI